MKLNSAPPAVASTFGKAVTLNVVAAAVASSFGKAGFGTDKPETKLAASDQGKRERDKQRQR